MPPLNVEQVRADFPILKREVHPGKKLVFLDSAASSQKPTQVIDAMSHYYQNSHANVHRGIYVLSEAATDAFETARNKVQRFINAAEREEVIFTGNTTGSMNMLAQTWGRQHLGPGDVLVLTVMEHHANIVPWQMLAAEKGFTIKYIPVTDDFRLDTDTYKQFLAEGNVKLVSLGHVSNVLGTINPITAIIEQAHKHDAVVVVDAAQSVPHMRVDVQALDVDFLAFSSHKMCGPTGIGVLYGKRALLEAMPPYMGGGDMIRKVTLDGSTWNDLPYKFEAGTPAIAEGIGLGAAVDYLESIGLDTIHEHEQMLGDYAHDRLSEIPGVNLFNPPSPHRSGVATFTVDNIHPHDIAQILDFEGIAVRAGHHCAMPLHREHLRVPATTRASFYLYTTTAEIDKLAEALYTAKKRFNS